MEKGNFEVKAEEFLKEGDKKLKGTNLLDRFAIGSFFGNLMTTKQDRMDEAKELYE